MSHQICTLSRPIGAEWSANRKLSGFHCGISPVKSASRPNLPGCPSLGYHPQISSWQGYNARMKTAIVAALGFLLFFAASTVFAQSDKALPVIALVGGTLIDLSNSGHGTHDIPNAESLVRLGLTPREALAAATSNYSEQFGWHELGLVEAGGRADLLILTADPTVDISNTRKIHSVILQSGSRPCCAAQCSPTTQIARCPSALARHTAKTNSPGSRRATWK